MAAQPFGVDLDFDDLDFSKYWDRRSKAILVDKLIKVVWNHINAEITLSFPEWQQRLNDVPSNPIFCHGKDLAKAAQAFFRYLYKMDSKVTTEILIMMMRLAVDHTIFENWSVVKRIRAWETKKRSEVCWRLRLKWNGAR